MQYTGELRKMPVTLDAQNLVHYTLLLVDTENQQTQELLLNDSVGKNISIQYTGQIFCKKCGRATSKSFNQGFCYPCFRDTPEAAECIIKPELCRAHLGEGRDPEWEERNHNQPHIVYLAATDVVKVGVTRATQIPTRWIDQGASSAIQLAQTPNRYTAGVIEVSLKAHFTDKTNWRKMLRNDIDSSIDLLAVKNELLPSLPENIQQYASTENGILAINYPVISFPEKVKSIGLDKNPLIEGKLLGIKGQYILLDGDRVMNIRKHEGYQIEISLED